MFCSSIHLLETESSGGNISWKFRYCTKLSGLRLCELIKWSNFDNGRVEMVFFLHLSGFFFLFSSTAMGAGNIFPWFWAVQNLKECHENTNTWQQNVICFFNVTFLYPTYRTTHWRNIGILIGTQCAWITSQERHFGPKPLFHIPPSPTPDSSYLADITESQIWDTSNVNRFLFLEKKSQITS